MNEIPEILRRALAGPVLLDFEHPREAKAWRTRAYNTIRKARDAYGVLMITQQGATVRIARPEFRIREG